MSIRRTEVKETGCWSKQGQNGKSGRIDQSAPCQSEGAREPEPVDHKKCQEKIRIRIKTGTGRTCGEN